MVGRRIHVDIHVNITVKTKHPFLGNARGAFDSAKNHKRQRRKRQSATAKREKSQTPKFV